MSRHMTCLQQSRHAPGIWRREIGEAPVLHARLSAEADDPDRQLLLEARPIVHQIKPVVQWPAPHIRVWVQLQSPLIYMSAAAN